MRRALRHPLRAGLAVGFVLRASLRAAWHEPRNALPELVGHLRSSPTSLVRPDLDIAETVLERFLPVLPPFRMGRCIKRSLILLDVWSRAGLTPCFHLGFLEGKRDRIGHAWISSTVPVSRTTAPGVVETFSA